jgi:hypothetical protein
VTQINLPNKSVTGTNFWSQVEDNDQAIADVVNGDLDAGNLTDGAVTTAKIGDSQVTTVKVGDGQITSPKLSLTVTQDTTNSSTNATNSLLDISGLSVSLVAGVYLLFATASVLVNSNATGQFFLYNQTDSAKIGTRQIVQRDASGITTYRSVSLIETVVLAGTKTIGVRFGPAPSTTDLLVAANEASVTAIRIG